MEASQRSLDWRALFLALLVVAPPAAAVSSVRDLNYGAVLYQFHQHQYFDALVEYEYADELGGIAGHGAYPELLKGGVSLSYGLSQQAEDIFTRLMAQNLPRSVQDRTWFYHGKMLFLKGDHAQAAESLARISGNLDQTLQPEFQHLRVLNFSNLGDYQQAVQVAADTGDDNPYSRYILFNKGVAQSRLSQRSSALSLLQQAAGGSKHRVSNDPLADRSRMAIAYTQAAARHYGAAREQLDQVQLSGLYSNRALLSYGWLSINEGEFGWALSPLQALSQRSIAIAEVQEAVILLPHVYEKMGLDGRAVSGFLTAQRRYGDALELLESARENLGGADLLELFVDNLDAIATDSDWFGAAPEVALNSLSPFVLELISDHEFQSVLKDLRDLYAIRNNLERWQARESQWALMLEARRRDQTEELSPSALHSRRRELSRAYAELSHQVSAMSKREQQRLRWLLDGLEQELTDAETHLGNLSSVTAPEWRGAEFGERVADVSQRVAQQAEHTEVLIADLEGVMSQLVRAELDLHQQRIERYQIQARLGKARVFDRNLMALDPFALNSDAADSSGAEKALPETVTAPGVDSRTSDDHRQQGESSNAT